MNSENVVLVSSSATTGSPISNNTPRMGNMDERSDASRSRTLSDHPFVRNSNGVNPFVTGATGSKEKKVGEINLKDYVDPTYWDLSMGTGNKRNHLLR